MNKKGKFIREIENLNKDPNGKPKTKKIHYLNKNKSFYRLKSSLEITEELMNLRQINKNYPLWRIKKKN